MKNLMLWENLERFALDDSDAVFRFSARLARENGWSERHTQKVLMEYRRFLYLCAMAGHAVTPSDDVDQAWHLHLCYTHSYWRDLCNDVLGFPLHHGPTRGGDKERTKYADWYGKTLVRYLEEFGENPPEDVWPPMKVRFTKQNFRRVNTNTYFILGKRTVASAAGIAGGALLLAGCATQIAAIQVETVVILFIAVMVVAVIVKLVGRGGKGGSGGCGGFFGCSGDSGCGGGGCGGGGD